MNEKWKNYKEIAFIYIVQRDFIPNVVCFSQKPMNACKSRKILIIQSFKTIFFKKQIYRCKWDTVWKSFEHI